MYNIKFKGRIFTDGMTSQGRQFILEDISNKLSELIKIKIQQAFQRSTELAAYIGQSPDAESVRAILRSINIKIVSLNPMKFGIKVSDNLGHWYNMDEPPPELIELIENIANVAFEKLNRDLELKSTVLTVLRGEQ